MNEELKEKIDKQAEELAKQYGVSVIDDNSNDSTPKPAITPNEDRNIVQDSKDKVLNEIESSDDFQKFARDLWGRDTYAEGEKQAIAIARKDLQNEFDRYALKQQKELLKAQAKYEKNLAKEEAKAKAMKKKVQIALDRYGYLYPLLDKDGKPQFDENHNLIVDMSKFTPSKTSNRMREWAYNYANLGKSTQKCIEITLKIALTILGVVALGGLLYGVGVLVLPILSKIIA